MPHCCNCGCDIPDTDKTKLCDNCKQIILPFVKFMDASTSSAVRRLVSNEKNLRNAGVTDGGMEYLLRICELHDRKKMREREEREAAQTASQTIPAKSAVPENETAQNSYTEMELPLDEPLNLCRDPYGKFLPLATYALPVLGAAAIIYEIVFGSLSIPVILCGAGMLLSSYVSFVCRKILHDLEEIKKRFR